MKRTLWAGLFVLALAGCATMGDPRVAALSVQVVESALTEAPVELQRAADQGQANAQLSYSIVLRYGLNGTKADADAAKAYHMLALASRGTTTTAIYVPNGKHSGHTQLVSIPRYDISGATAWAADDCVDALQTQVKAEAIGNRCGGADTYTHLAGLWAQARP